MTFLDNHLSFEWESCELNITYTSSLRTYILHWKIGHGQLQVKQVTHIEVYYRMCLNTTDNTHSIWGVWYCYKSIALIEMDDRACSYVSIYAVKCMFSRTVTCSWFFTLCFSSGRLCNEDCVVGNLLVKKGVQVLAQVYTMHHNAELWSNPEKFDPERYTNKRCIIM